LGISAAEAGVNVYDSRAQYLGTLLDVHAAVDDSGESATADLFVPSLGRAVQVDLATGNLVSEAQQFWYSDSSCLGTPYVGPALFLSVGWIDGYYTGANARPKWMWMRSCRRFSLERGMSCETLPAALPFWGVEAVPVRLPFSDPVVLPLRFRGK
jgi:hypothetical protein